MLLRDLRMSAKVNVSSREGLIWIEEAPFVLYSTPLGKDFQEIVQQHCHILKSDSNLKSVFKDSPCVVHKHALDICDLIARADLPTEHPTQFLSANPDGN